MNHLPNPDNLPLGRLRRVSLLVGAAAVAVCVVGLFVDASQFYRSYLFSFVYWWTITMGCLGVSLLYQMTGGQWGYAARPFFDSGVRTLPLIALAFIPVAIGMEHLYDWMQPDYFTGDPHAYNRQWYLQQDFFLIRTAVGFVLCIVLGWVLTLRVIRADGTMAGRQLPMVGGIGAVLVVNIVTLEAIDWTMTLQPDYYSTLYGALFVGAALLCGTCVAAAGVALTIMATGRGDEASLTAMHDVGKLLLAMVMVWAYLSFSQFLITYSGNLPSTATWYLVRLQGGWQWLGVALVVLHFAAPFLLLLSRSLKRNAAALGALAIGLVAVHVLDVFWIVAPSFHQTRLTVHWLDIAALAALGGIWLGMFFRELKYRLVPVMANWPHPGAGDE